MKRTRLILLTAIFLIARANSAHAQYPYMVTATPLCGAMQLDWTTDLPPAIPIEYRLYRDNVRIGTVPYPTFMYTDSMASASSHVYRVRLYYQANIFYFEANGASTTAPANPPPPTVGNFSVADTICGRVELSWTYAYPFDHFDLYRDSSLLATSVTSFQYTDSLGNLDIPHAYGINAVTDNNCSSAQVNAFGTLHGHVGDMSSLGYFLSNCTAATISWQPVPHVAFYRVTANGVFQGEVVDASFIFNLPANPLPEYNFEVTPYGYSSCGTGAPSDLSVFFEDSSTGMASGLTATSTLCEGIALAWSVSGNPPFCKIFRDSVVIASVPGTQTTYLDSTATAGIDHTYFVWPFASPCYGIPSTNETGRRGVEAADDLVIHRVNATDVEFRWTAPMDFSGSYSVFLSATDATFPGPSWSEVASGITPANGTAGTHYTHTNGLSGAQLLRYYVVVAVCP